MVAELLSETVTLQRGNESNFLLPMKRSVQKLSDTPFISSIRAGLHALAQTVAYSG